MMNQIEVDEELINAAATLTREVLIPNAARIDNERAFPQSSFDAMRGSPLLSAWLPRAAGGRGTNHSTFVRMMEHIGGGCGSTGLCFLMHSTASAILGVAAKEGALDRFLQAIVEDGKLATLAQSEGANGSNFFIPSIQIEESQGGYVLNGEKRFVSSGGHADFYLLLARSSDPNAGMDMLIVERESPGVSFCGEWDGMGMKGNSSIDMKLDNARIPRENLVGGVGQGMSLLFGINASVFIVGNAALNIGIAQRALDVAVEHAKSRTHPQAGGSIGNHQIIRYYIAQMYCAVNAARAHLHRAACDQDLGVEDALISLMASKVLGNDVAIRATDLAMQVCGGLGYRSDMPIERLYRDARAGAVMGPTSELLRDWIGKSLLEMPLV